MRTTNGYQRSGRTSRKTPAVPAAAQGTTKGTMPAGEMVRGGDLLGMPRGEMTSAQATGPGPMPKGDMLRTSAQGEMPRGTMTPAAQAGRS